VEGKVGKGGLSVGDDGSGKQKVGLTKRESCSVFGQEKVRSLSGVREREDA